MSAICATCSGECRLTDGREIYPHCPEFADKKIYVCDPCGARVGCHPGTTNPLGTAADQKTRNARMATHGLLDPFWKGNKSIKRRDVYAYLAFRMGIDAEKCHVGMFSASQCYEANKVLRDTCAVQIRKFVEGRALP